MALLILKLKKQFIAPDGGVVPVIDVASFTLADTEQVALIGGSGTGKTTLLHLIAGILVPDSGQILFDFPGDTNAMRWASTPSLPAAMAAASVSGAGVGEMEPEILGYQSAGQIAPPTAEPPVDITQLSEARRDVFRGRNIGYIFQTHHLLPGFTALENVLLGMSFSGRRRDSRWAKHLLAEVGLSDRFDFRPSKLSVGQQQRVAVARSLANRPRLVLADEPTGALDPKAAQQVLELIRKLCAEVRAGLLLVSHDMAIAGQLPRSVVLADLNAASRV